MERSDRFELYNRVCRGSSRALTRTYSTSFSLSIGMLSRDIRDDIFAIYGFVRLADEVVDSFHGHDQAELLRRLRLDVNRALDERISTNPVLQAFQETAHRYGIERDLVETFLRSMEWDLHRSSYDRESFDEYVVGSAEVVGLMCLHVFVRGDKARYDQLKSTAVRLGAAFQKVNFLRDLREDTVELGRIYFPGFDVATFDDAEKRRIEEEIEADLDAARPGIRGLPRDARLATYTAYALYRRLLHHIRRQSSRSLLRVRVRVPAREKFFVLAAASLRHRINLI